MSRFTTLMGALLFAVLSTSCNKTNPSASTSTVQDQLPVALPTKDEVAQFGRDLEQAVRVQDDENMDLLLRPHDMYRRALGNMEMSDAEFRKFLQQFEWKLSMDVLGNDMLRCIQSGGSVKFLRTHEVDGRSRALFRLSRGGLRVLEGQDLEYHDVMVMRYPDGKVGFEDEEAFLEKDELKSQSLRRDIRDLLKSKIANSPADEADLDATKAIEELQRSRKRQDTAPMSERYRQFSKERQENKRVLIHYIRKLEDDNKAEAELLKSIERFRTLFPQDPRGDLMMTRYHVRKNDFAAALKDFAKVESFIGSDACLMVQKAMLCCAANDFAQAKKLLDDALKAEPEQIEVYWGLVNAALHEKNHAESLKSLKQIVKLRQVEIGDLTKIKECAEFVKSKEHREWLDWYSAYLKDHPLKSPK